MAPRKPRRLQRRQPRQERSRATVDVIVEATTRVLLKHGYEALSTNQVAREAGVSIGSVYQYFPDKAALVVAVLERFQAQMRDHIAARLAQVGHADTPTVVRELLRAMLEVSRLQPRLHRVLLEEVPRLGALARQRELHAQFEPLVTAWLEAHRAHLGIPDPSVAAWVLLAAVEGLVTRVVVEKPAWLDLGLLEEQAVRLVLTYLGVAPTPQRRRAEKKQG